MFSICFSGTPALTSLNTSLDVSLSHTFYCVHAIVFSLKPQWPSALCVFIFFLLFLFQRETISNLTELFTHYKLKMKGVSWVELINGNEWQTFLLRANEKGVVVTLISYSWSVGPEFIGWVL